MTVNPSGWRPSTSANQEGDTATVTGNRALMLEEPLLFEIGSTEQTGVDFADFPRTATRLGGLERNRGIGLAGLIVGDQPEQHDRHGENWHDADQDKEHGQPCAKAHPPGLS